MPTETVPESNDIETVAPARVGDTLGYARVSKADGSQSLDLQREALRAEGIDDPANLYHDFASGGRDDRPGLDSCVRALRKGDVLVVWKLGRLGRPRSLGAGRSRSRRPPGNASSAALSRARRATAPTAPGPPAARGSASGRSAAGASRWRLSYAPSHRPCRRRYCLFRQTRPPPESPPASVPGSWPSCKGSRLGVNCSCPQC